MKVYGLIGYPLTHSFSRKYFTEKFATEGIAGCRYENFPLENIAGLTALLQNEKNLCGLNVTIPYKEQVIPFLDEASGVVTDISACNCIRIVDGKLFGFNTDVAGFRHILLKQLKPFHQHALVLGTGGAAKAVEFVLKEQNIRFKTVSRNKSGARISYQDINKSLMEEHLLIINTTPLGMYPDLQSFPDIRYEFLSDKHLCIDLIYNPAKTKFLELAEEKGAVIQNGSDMLIVQAEESWKIWNS